MRSEPHHHGFALRPYRQVVAAQALDCLRAIPDAAAAVAIVASIACACWGYSPVPPRAPHIVLVQR